MYIHMIFDTTYSKTPTTLCNDNDAIIELYCSDACFFSMALCCKGPDVEPQTTKKYVAYATPHFPEKIRFHEMQFFCSHTWKKNNS